MKYRKFPKVWDS